MQTQEMIVGWPGVMVALGLGHPVNRGVTAALATGTVLYLAKYPSHAFRGNRVRPLAGLSPDPNAVELKNHFILIPLAVGVAVGICT